MSTLEDLAVSLGPLRLPREFCPVDPSVKQEFFLRRNELEVFFGGAAGPGKLLDCRTEVPTPTGWTTIGALQVGEDVFGEDGKPHRVEWLSDIDLRPESYRLTFDDGTAVDACADHLWLTYDASELGALTRRDPAWRARRRGRRGSRAVAVSQKPAVSALVATRNRESNPAVTLPPPSGTVRTTREIASTLLTARGRRNHAIPVAAALELPPADLPLEPYVLGAWLGDGHTNSGHITSADPEVLAEFAAAGWPSRRVPSSPYGWRVIGLTARLRELCLLGRKHVPAVYLRASIPQRLALLQGLMDTDGTCDPSGQVEFTSTLEGLARAVHELACSLGQKARIRQGRSKLDGVDHGPTWRVSWTPTIPAFRLARKLARQREEVRRTGAFRYVVACDRIPPIPMRCIRVANPSCLFLVGRSMVPTHNSFGLLMASLMYVDVPDYHALILRTVLQDHKKEKALIPVSHQWLGPTRATWNGSTLRWQFPSGASLTFGYARTVQDLSHFKGPAYAFVGFDETTEFPELVYQGVSRVLRDAPIIGSVDGTEVKVPLRKRSASNPGGPGHGWVKRRFIDPRTADPDAVTIKATILDNPKPGFYEEYMPSLAHLSPVDRLRLINGDWDVMEEGGKFDREKFRHVEPAALATPVKAVRYWDLAGTEPTPSNPDPDYTVGVLTVVDQQGFFTVLDIVRGRWADAKVETIVRQTAELDRQRVTACAVHTFVEQDPGQAGKAQVNHYKRVVLQGFPVYAGSTRINGVNAAKLIRAAPCAAAVANDLYGICPNPHLVDYLDEVAIFPNGEHDDCVDATSGAHNAITTRVSGGGGGGMRGSRPRGRIPGAAAPRR